MKKLLNFLKKINFKFIGGLLMTVVLFFSIVSMFLINNTDNPSNESIVTQIMNMCYILFYFQYINREAILRQQQEILELTKKTTVLSSLIVAILAGHDIDSDEEEIKVDVNFTQSKDIN